MEIINWKLRDRLSAMNAKIMGEVVDSCDAPGAMDQDEFPVAVQEGHGLGMQSIRSFCQRYRATCSCRYRQGQFCLQIAF